MVVFERHNFVFNFFDYQWRRAGLMGPASERAASIPFSFWDFYFSFFFSAETVKRIDGRDRSLRRPDRFRLWPEFSTDRISVDRIGQSDGLIAVCRNEKRLDFCFRVARFPFRLRPFRVRSRGGFSRPPNWTPQPAYAIGRFDCISRPSPLMS